uniref:Methyltransferase domain-containing protein n=1 Tax=Tetraselmis sp. GSL018 TaxID=582737 RepID=A0A061SH74_9CHLO|mmetsp:Transcript_27074/g.64194  ORF Transcript_27074/g.64194 Transcript_27074/m.64194 type:complete len:201 (-) Transcript_27074:78-680(-)|eukprot:CAMPEP_0177588432 /NCGR_PEP_ID=MMETSP0419_2-20121207/6220_1 /TAXON_ID=582737 /ORGANISM="Tetraselmis sp., Strain GSL018" /LENGTH=200 /DNA_ID=CAMNT_0019078625 /DNA_START=279 /DNA_END=881 /DNA_ORIENTATION=-
MISKSHASSIRGCYQALGVRRFYEERGGDYVNPHFATLVEVTPGILSEILLPRLYEIAANGGMLDLCCGSGEMTVIFRSWLEEVNSTIEMDISAADPFTCEAYKRSTGKMAETWSFEDVCDGVLDDLGLSFGLVCISYAVHLLEPSRNSAFFQNLSRHSRLMLIVSPTKNKGIVDESLGWRQAEYRTVQRIHFRLYETLV